MAKNRRVRSGSARSICAARVTRILLVTAACVASSPADSAEQRRKIYFLESLAPTQPAAIRTIDAFKQRLAEKTNESFDIFIDYMDLERFPGQPHIDRTVQFLTGKYAEAPPDVLIPLGRAAIPFMLRYRDTIAPRSPIIMANVPARAARDASRIRDAIWVVTEYDFAKTLEFARRLQPNARNIVIIAGASDYDHSWLDDARRELEPYRDRYEIGSIADLPYEEMLKRAAQLPSDTIIMMSFVFMDGAGLARTPPAVAAAIAKVAGAPIYSPASTFFGRGIVGGYMDSFEAHGVAAADLALAILSGKPIAALDRYTRPIHQYQADARQLARWDLSVKNLPPQTIISFREPTIWNQYRNIVLATAVVFIVQSVLLAGLLIQRGRRRRAEAEAEMQRQKVASLTRAREREGRTITMSAMSASIAHEMSQPIGAMMASADAALLWLEKTPPDFDNVRTSIERIAADGRRAGDLIASVRTLFRKSGGKQESVVVNELISEVLAIEHGELAHQRIQLKVELANAIPRVWFDRVQLQQVVLNLITNAVEAMSSVADRPRVLHVTSQNHGQDQVLIAVADSGAGIDLKTLDRIFEPFFTTKSRGMGLGLWMCRTIVENHNGRLTTDSEPGRGSVFRIILPSEGAAGAAPRALGTSSAE